MAKVDIDLAGRLKSADEQTRLYELIEWIGAEEKRLWAVGALREATIDAG